MSGPKEGCPQQATRILVPSTPSLPNKLDLTLLQEKLGLIEYMPAGGRQGGDAMYFCLTATYLKDKSQQSECPTTGTSLVVLWLRLQAPDEGGPGLIPAQGIHMPQLRVWMLQIKTPHATTKTQHSQIKLINVKPYNTTDMKLTISFFFLL